MYLSEENLGKLLENIFPGMEIIHNRKIPGYIEKCRPDYRIPSLKLIFEFDGPTHYTNSKRILLDKKNDNFYHEVGYNVIRIPYFIQMNKTFYKNILNIERESDYNFPQGFIEKNIIYPADYCYAGLEKFTKDLEKFSFFKDEIISSLKNACNELEEDLILPNNLKYLFKEKDDRTTSN